MSQDKKNMELYFEEKIKRSLSNKASEHFTSNVMHKISQEMQFAQEDKQTEKISKKIIGALSLVTLGMIVLLGYLLASDSSSTASNFSEDLIITFNRYIYEIQNAIGIQMDWQTVVFAIFFMLIVAVYSISDKFIFRRR
jgi:hypothetical protein